jgi:copper chaperone NosL
MPPRTARRWWLALAALVGLAALALLLHRAQRLPDGPEPIVWDQEACAHCRMLISAPEFAAQLQDEDGRVFDFDDPGCLLRYVSERQPRVHALWFRHAQEDRWLRADQVAFRRVAETPMDWGLAAVDASEPHDLELAAAEAQIAAPRAAAAPSAGAAR